MLNRKARAAAAARSLLRRLDAFRIRHPFPAGVALLASLWAAASWPWLMGRAFVPWDSMNQFFPQSFFVVTSLLRADAPWWNPYVFAGVPVLGDPQSMIFVPHTAVGLAAGAAYNLGFFDLTTLGMVLCGGLALYRYGLALGGGRALPLLGAVVFVLGGAATSRLQHVPQVISYALLPFALLAVQSLCAKPVWSRALCVAVVGLGLLLNPNQVVFLSAFMLAPLVALHVAASPHPKRAVAALAAASAAALLAAMPSLDAIHETIGISTRSTMQIDEAAIASFPAINLFSLILPGLFGVLTPQHGLWPTTDTSQDYLYIGVIPAAIVLCSLLRRNRPPAIVRICQAMLAVAFLFALGSHAPLFPVLFEFVPGFSAFRRPADAAYFVNLFASLLVVSAGLRGHGRTSAWFRFVPTIAVCGLLIALFPALWQHAERGAHGDELLLSLRSFAARAAVAGAGALLLLALLRRRAVDVQRRAVLAVPALLFTTADLTLAGRIGPLFCPRNPQAEASAFYRRPAEWRQMQGGMADTVRFLVDHGVAGPGAEWRMEALGGPLGAAMPLFFGIADAQGYNPLRLASYARVFGAQNLLDQPKRFTGAAPGYGSEAYRWLGVRYVLMQGYIADRPGEFGAVGEAVARIETEMQEAGWANRLAVSGAYDVWELPGAYRKARLIEGKGDECRVQSYRNTSLVVQCRARAAGTLVVNDTMAPGWTACVNGRPASIGAFLGVFRAVPVPEGESLVTMRYAPVPLLRAPDPKGDCGREVR